ncbi:hypothetical protein [Klebsiella spallanzanii]|uniref:hypothetical protein n=1 Tax=Klebsiella spallanzanii TaxID=2587528 RepID=UPI00115746B3|nr:hypothetical protein [Klebsiella spallanzanii]VUS67611.1 hypothetical protein SB6419_04046 [Klebsiella spallanzanii]
MEKGGSVHNYISYLHVDAIPGVDNTGEASSTEAINSALLSLLGRDTSVYNYGETKFITVIFGNGTYKASLPIISGVAYVGQGKFATRIIPDPGEFCFYTVGTADYYNGGVDGNRLIASAVKYLAIGDYQESLSGSPYSGSGIQLAYSSYCKVEDVSIYRLTGFGLKLEQCWDSEFVNVRIMECSSDHDADGESCGLFIGPGETTGDDGSNALRFRGLHIENCTKLLHIGKNSRHIFFEAGCKLEGITTTQSCTIEGADSISFVAPELTWSRSTYPMFYMVETAGDLTTSNRSISFVNPSLRSPANTSRRGWYIQYASSISRLDVINPHGRYASRIIEGSNWKVDGGSFLECGPILAIMEGNCEFLNVTSLGTLSTTTDPHIYVNGVGCRVMGNTIESTGSIDDTASVIRVSSVATDARIQGQQFSGSRQYAIRLENESCRPFVFDNHVVNGGTFGAPVYGWYQTYTPASRDTSGFGIGGVASKGATTISSGASSTMTARGAHMIAMRAVISSGYAAALLFVDASTGTVSKVADPTGTFSVTSGSSGDGLIHLSQSEGVLTITNYTAVDITIYATGISALM